MIFVPQVYFQTTSAPATNLSIRKQGLIVILFIGLVGLILRITLYFCYKPLYQLISLPAYEFLYAPLGLILYDGWFGSLAPGTK